MATILDISLQKTRDFTIDVLKFIAALIITWSHLENQFGEYSALATGGSFGDSLFFFCSGYTLLLSSKKLGFFNWYKRRINRIYPTVFAWALICCLFFDVNWDIGFILTKGGGFFVTCIMIFYLMMYPIKIFLQNQLSLVMVVYFVLCTVAYFFIDHSDSYVMYCWIWSMYFLPFLFGAILGKAQKNGQLTKLKNLNWSVKFAGLIFSAIVYYVLMYLIGRYDSLNLLYPLIILPQLGVVYYFYALCNSSFVEKAYNNKRIHIFMMWVGGMCLEIYIVQPRLLHAFPMTTIFPLNIFIIFGLIFVCAFALKILSRIWEQTFKDADYNWKDIIKMY